MDWQAYKQRAKRRLRRSPAVAKAVVARQAVREARARRRVTGAPKDGLTPIVVGATGRSGTTLIMQLLGSSDDVAFDRIYAYEHSYLAYFWQWAHAPEQGAQKAQDWNRSAIDQQDLLERHGLVGGVPWSPRPGIAGSTKLGDDLLRSAWPAISRRLTVAHLADHPTAPSHYAETAPPWLVPVLAKALPATRPMYLIRDPRDQWLSMMSFINKTGQHSFGHKPFHTPPGFAEIHAGRQKETFATLAGLPDDGSTYVVRYESLVDDLDAESARLGDWLGVTLHPDVVRSNRTAMARHTTSSSAKGSAGRWRSEMDPVIAGIFDKIMGDELEALGYPRAAD